MLFNYFSEKKLKMDKKNSEHFLGGNGRASGMGNGHAKILDEFLNDKINKSSMKLDIDENLYILKLIHSIYNSIFKEKKYSTVKQKEFIYEK